VGLSGTNQAAIRPDLGNVSKSRRHGSSRHPRPDQSIRKYYWKIVIDELLDRGKALWAKKGNGNLNLYPTVTCTIQLGLLTPSSESHVPPVEVVPGHEVDTVRFEDESPGGSILTT